MQHQHYSTPIKISINENILKHVKISLLYFRTSRGMVKHSFCIYFGLFPFALENCSNFYVCRMRAMIQILQMKLLFQWLVSSVHSYWEVGRSNLIYPIRKWVLFCQFKTGTVPFPWFVSGLTHWLFKSQTLILQNLIKLSWAAGEPDLLFWNCGWKQISAKSWVNIYPCHSNSGHSQPEHGIELRNPVLL